MTSFFHMFIQSPIKPELQKKKRTTTKKSYFRNNEHIWFLNVYYVSVQYPSCDGPLQTKEQVLM